MVLPIRPVSRVLEKLDALWVTCLKSILGVTPIPSVRIRRTRLCFWMLGRPIIIRWLKWLGCSRVGLRTLVWPAVVTMTIPEPPLKLLTLISRVPSARLCLLPLLFTLQLCRWFMVLTLLTKTRSGVASPVRLNTLWIWSVFIFMNTLIKLELSTEQKEVPDLLVTVCVSRAPFALGVLITSMLWGTAVFRLWNPLGPCRNLISLYILLPVLSTLVILPNAIPPPLGETRCVWSPLKSTVFWVLLSRVWNTKNRTIRTSMTGSRPSRTLF